MNRLNTIILKIARPYTMENTNSSLTLTTNETSENLLPENLNIILDEINYRFSLINKFNIFIKNLPKSFTRSNLKDLIPEMSFCRIPEKTKSGKVNYAFVQFSNENLADKYIDLLNKKKINGKNLIVKKLKSKKEFTDIDKFHWNKLYASGLKSDVKYREIKSLYPNAKVSVRTNKSHRPEGPVVLTFDTDKDALSAFIDNKLILHGVKYQLIYVIKKQMTKAGESKVEEISKFSFNEPEKLLEEIKDRFNDHNSRSVIVKNLPASFTLAKLRKLVPNIRNCRIRTHKRIGFIDLDNSENANESVKTINGTVVEGQKIRAFVSKQTANMTSLSVFDLSKLHLTNLSFDTTENDLKAKFPNCEIDFHLNTDETCIGYATLNFENSEDALKVFSRNNYQIKDVPICVNFHRESKSIEKPIKIQMPNITEEKNEKLENKKKVVNKDKPKKEMKTVKKQDKLVTKKEKSKPLEKKIVENDQLTEKKNETVQKIDVKQEMNKNKNPVLSSQKPGKRKFEEIDDKVNEVSAKKSRITIKAKVNNKMKDRKEK